MILPSLIHFHTDPSDSEHSNFSCKLACGTFGIARHRGGRNKADVGCRYGALIPHRDEFLKRLTHSHLCAPNSGEFYPDLALFLRQRVGNGRH